MDISKWTTSLSPSRVREVEKYLENKYDITRTNTSNLSFVHHMLREAKRMEAREKPVPKKLHPKWIDMEVVDAARSTF